jgi:hypothetical protein
MIGQTDVKKHFSLALSAEYRFQEDQDAIKAVFGSENISRSKFKSKYLAHITVRNNVWRWRITWAHPLAHRIWEVLWGPTRQQQDKGMDI